MTGFALVTPSFNQAAFLPACLESVQGQAGVTLEHEVRDGGSTDGTVALLKAWPRPLRWSSGPDGGQVAAINAGLQSLPGELCGYLNSDDVLLPGALAAVAKAFTEDPALDLLYGRAWFIDASGRRTREYPTLDYDFRHLVQHCFVCQPATFWRRRLHERHGWFDPAFDSTFDYEFWLRVASRGARIRHLPEFLAESREHPETKSSRRRGDIFAEIRRMQLRHLGYCGRNWWEQHLRYWRDESGHPFGRLLPGRRDVRMYRLAWWPYMLWRRKWGGPLFYRSGDWRA